MRKNFSIGDLVRFDINEIKKQGEGARLEETEGYVSFDIGDAVMHYDLYKIYKISHVDESIIEVSDTRTRLKTWFHTDWFIKATAADIARLRKYGRF